MVATTNRAQGTLTRWDDARGFGYISPTVPGPDVFVHIKAFPLSSDRPMLYELLTYDIERAKDGRTRAAHVEYVFPTRTGKPQYRDTAVPGALHYVAIVAFILIWIDVSSYWSIPIWVLALYLLVSLLTFVTYRNDKRAATSHAWRTPESALLALGLVGGWPGAIVAQQVLHHKNRKKEFQSQFWATVIVNVVAFVVLGSPGFATFVANLIQSLR